MTLTMTPGLAWTLLLLAGLLEVVWVMTMKASAGFTRPGWAVATMVSEWSLDSLMRKSKGSVHAAASDLAAAASVGRLGFMGRSGGNKNQRLEEKSASGEALWGKTLNQPLMPQASVMRPISMASAGSAAVSKGGRMTCANRSGCGFAGLTDQAFHGGGSLGANALPIGQSVLSNAQTFFAAFGCGVVETDALEETTIATNALVSYDDVEKRTCFRAAAVQTNNNHDLSLGGWVSWEQMPRCPVSFSV